jgi:hypothetical protein
LFSICFRTSTNLLPLAIFACVVLSKSEPNLAKVSNSRKAANSSFNDQATFLTIPVWAEPHTRDTESQTLIAGLTQELNKLDSR